MTVWMNSVHPAGKVRGEGEVVMCEGVMCEVVMCEIVMREVVV